MGCWSVGGYPLLDSWTMDDSHHGLSAQSLDCLYDSQGKTVGDDLTLFLTLSLTLNLTLSLTLTLFLTYSYHKPTVLMRYLHSPILLCGPFVNGNFPVKLQALPLLWVEIGWLPLAQYGKIQHTSALVYLSRHIRARSGSATLGHCGHWPFRFSMCRSDAPTCCMIITLISMASETVVYYNIV